MANNQVGRKKRNTILMFGKTIDQIGRDPEAAAVEAVGELKRITRENLEAIKRVEREAEKIWREYQAERAARMRGVGEYCLVFRHA